MKIFKAPEQYPPEGVKIFLAGSIEQGTAEDWQSELTNRLQAENANVTVLNPRRDNWDASWEQSIHNKEFAEQVNWELNAQQEADLIVMYFAPETKSPITLMELGLFKNKPMVVCCPDGFWRKGNVEIVCDRFQIPLIHRKEEFMKRVTYLILGLAGYQ